MSPAPRQVDVIAVGGSAGAVEALGILLEALPEDFRPAIVAVLHVPADRPSLLAGVLGSRCRLPVHEAMDKDFMEPGHVYVAPPDYHLLIESDGMLSLSRDAPVAYSRPSIDVMLESAAEACGERVLGIVLSGANSDGALGSAAIRKAGGRCWVQDPADALASAMPIAAIQQGADLVLPVRDMAQRLAHLRSGTAFAL